jgi:hypothetical protein
LPGRDKVLEIRSQGVGDDILSASVNVGLLACVEGVGIVGGCFADQRKMRRARYNVWRICCQRCLGKRR